MNVYVCVCVCVLTFTVQQHSEVLNFGSPLRLFPLRYVPVCEGCAVGLDAQMEMSRSQSSSRKMLTADTCGEVFFLMAERKQSVLESVGVCVCVCVMHDNPRDPPPPPLLKRLS